MLLWLLHRCAGLADSLDAVAAGDSRVYLTTRTALAALGSFLAAMLLGPLAIRWLQGRFPERIDSASQRLNELHAVKQRTPTMGGLFILGAILAAVLVCGDLANPYVPLALFVGLSFGAVGAIDDWIKLSTTRRGLTVRQKFAAQTLLAAIAATWLYSLQRDLPGGLALTAPIGALTPVEPGGWFIPWCMLVLVGSSNGVNLTDGLDGLAAGCLLSAGTACAALTYLAGHHNLAGYFHVPAIPGAGEMTVVLGSLLGALLGFLWFNAHPAQVFMGDTGALPLGALLGLAALIARQELLLIVIGGVFVIETVSVILQVGCYKLSGRRILACSPLHNHYLFRGQHEVKIVTRFWIVGALLAILGVALLKLR